MTSRPAIFAASLVLAACTGARDPAPREHAHSDMSKKPPSQRPLEGYPLGRLALDHNPVEPLDLPLREADWKKAGAVSYQAFTATTPRVWLLVFEFTDEGALLTAVEDPRRALNLPEPPYYTAAAFTGRWLLVTGFPSDKPVSPEMEAARTIFLHRWAGEG
ncbi:MAG TPA: hypothetical protein VIK91_03675 [Nannocystis sp.]